MNRSLVGAFGLGSFALLLGIGCGTRQPVAKPGPAPAVPGTPGQPPGLGTNDTPASKEPLTITAEKACDEITRDPKGAAAKFNDRPLTLTGVVYDFWGRPHLFRMYGGENQFVDVLIDNAEMPPKFQQGQTVTVSGKGEFLGGFSEFLSVKECKFVSAEPFVRPEKPLPCFVSTTVDKLLAEAAKGPDAMTKLVFFKKNKLFEQVPYKKALIVEGVVEKLDSGDVILASLTGQGQVVCDFAEFQEDGSFQPGQKITVVGQYFITNPAKDGAPLQVKLQDCYLY